jgi:hypothetical protein
MNPDPEHCVGWTIYLAWLDERFTGFEKGARGSSGLIMT